MILLSVEATKLGVNPAFYAKMAFVAVGLARLCMRQPDLERGGWPAPLAIMIGFIASVWAFAMLVVLFLMPFAILKWMLW